jgi:hypothetical protein
LKHDLSVIQEEIVMSFKLDHPEQDPAEGSRKVVERELARQRQKAHTADESKEQPHSGSDRVPKPAEQDHRPM